MLGRHPRAFGVVGTDHYGADRESVLDVAQVVHAVVQMYSIITGTELDEVENSVQSAVLGNWKPGYVRLFMSHSARHKEFVGKVADELAVVGIHGLVAHDTMKYDTPWQAQIEQAL